MTGIADRVKELRRARGLSQTHLAGDDLSPSYVSLIESGKRTPTAEALAVLARRLGTTATYLATGQEHDADVTARLELAYAEVALANGEADDARSRILALDMNAVPPAMHGRVQLTLASCLEKLGDLEGAARLLERVLAETGDSARWLEHAEAAMMLVGCYLESGDLNRAVDVGDAALTCLREAQLVASDEGIRLAATVIWALHERGDLLYAQMRAAELTDLAEKEGSHRARASIYWNSALVAQSRGNDEEALRLTERALALFAEESSSRDLPRLRVHYAGLLLDGQPNDAAEALRQLESAMPRLEESSSVVDMAYCSVEQARAHLYLGEIQAAEQAAQRALSLLGDQPRLEACHARLILGDIAWAEGDTTTARRHYQQAAGTLAMMEASRAASAAWRKLGDRLKEAGDLDDAMDAYDKALSERGLPAAAKPLAATSRREKGTY